jgi:hypothetical protein
MCKIIFGNLIVRAVILIPLQNYWKGTVMLSGLITELTEIGVDISLVLQLRTLVAMKHIACKLAVLLRCWLWQVYEAGILTTICELSV